MLTSLLTIKSRLAIIPADTQYDALLTAALKAVSARFDKETRRTLARTVDFTQEFDPYDTEIIARCYPIESVSKFETKTDEDTGWVEQTGIKYLLRSACIISLLPPSSLILHPSSFPSACRVTYTGGYLLPDSPPAPGATPLPDDLEQAAVEQVAHWFQTRDHLGIRTSWPSGGEYKQFAAANLLPAVSAVLSTHAAYSL